MAKFRKPREIEVEKYPNCYYTLQSVARYLEVHPDTLRRQGEKGKIKIKHIGTCPRIRGTEVLRYLKEEC